MCTTKIQNRWQSLGTFKDSHSSLKSFFRWIRNTHLSFLTTLEKNTQHCDTLLRSRILWMIIWDNKCYIVLCLQKKHIFLVLMFCCFATAFFAFDAYSFLRCGPFLMIRICSKNTTNNNTELNTLYVSKWTCQQKYYQNKGAHYFTGETKSIKMQVSREPFFP